MTSWLTSEIFWSPCKSWKYLGLFAVDNNRSRNIFPKKFCFVYRDGIIIFLVSDVEIAYFLIESCHKYCISKRPKWVDIVLSKKYTLLLINLVNIRGKCFSEIKHLFLKIQIKIDFNTPFPFECMSSLNIDYVSNPKLFIILLFTIWWNLMILRSLGFVIIPILLVRISN